MNHPDEPRECVPRIDDLVAALKGKAFVLREPVTSDFFDALEPAWRRPSLTFLEDARALAPLAA